MSSPRQLFAALTWVLLFSACSAQTFYTQPCSILNLYYPAPSSYASSDVVASAVSSLSQNITQALNQTTPYGQLDSQSNAFSIDIYSLQDEEPLFNYHYTPEQLIASHSVGVQTVDSNTIYRIGSIGKVITVYTYLIAAGDDTWNQPVTNFVPELAAYAEMNQAALEDDTISIVDWKSITIGALAGQLSGIAREDTYSPAFEQSLQSALNLPPPARNESAMCGDDTIKTPCDRQAFFDNFLTQRPVTSPFTTPIYSNTAFQILGYAIENITGTSMADLFNETLVQRLGLNGSYYTVPSSPNASFIPGNESTSLWNFDARGETPTGGQFMSVNDMRKIGRSLFNYTLLTGAQTRRWMKPHSLTAGPNLVLGAPWEIVRATGEPVTWIYSKTGNFGAYGGIVAFMPEYKVGFTVLGAGAGPSEAARIISDIVADNLVPTVYAAAREAAVSTYAGTYTNTTNNATITIAAPDSGPGLIITQLDLNGTSGLALLASIYGLNATTQALNVTIYPSGLTANNGMTTSWRAIFRISPQVLDPGPFSENCVSWGTANTLVYGDVGLDEFLFTLGGDGTTASTVEPRILGLDMLRANGSAMPSVFSRV